MRLKDQVFKVETSGAIEGNTLKAFGSKPSYKVYEKLKEDVESGAVVLQLVVPTAQNPTNMVSVPASKIDIIRGTNGGFEAGAGGESFEPVEI